LLCLLFTWLLGDDMKRRGWQNELVFRLVSLVPLFGALAYLCVRPNLPEASSQTEAASLGSQL